METPQIPMRERFRSLGISLLTIVWWVAIWGLSDTIIHHVFKSSIAVELALYISMIAFVMVMIFIFPEVSKSF